MEKTEKGRHNRKMLKCKFCDDVASVDITTVSRVCGDCVCAGKLTPVNSGSEHKAIKIFEKRTHRKYEPGFVVEAVKQVTEGGKKVSDVAESLGIHENMLRKWIKNSRDTSKQGNQI